MAYTNLINAISAVVKTNGNGEITGQNMQDVLKSIVNTIGANATFAGIATPATVPPSTATNANVFYIASQNGTYSNFGGIVVADEVAILSNADGSWTKISTNLPMLSNVNDIKKNIDGVLDVVSADIYDNKAYATYQSEYQLNTTNTRVYLNNQDINIVSGHKYLLFADFDIADLSGYSAGFLYLEFIYGVRLLLESEFIRIVTNGNKILSGVVTASSTGSVRPVIFSIYSNPNYTCTIKPNKIYLIDVSNASNEDISTLGVLLRNKPYSDRITIGNIADGIVGISSLNAELTNKINGFETEINNLNGTYIPENVDCWGDSLTAGALTTTMPYPQKLQQLIGSSKVVTNYGHGGETAAAIAFRQGGLQIIVKPFTAEPSVRATINYKASNGMSLETLFSNANGVQGIDYIKVNNTDRMMFRTTANADEANVWNYTTSAFTHDRDTIAYAQGGGVNHTIIICMGQNGLYKSSGTTIGVRTNIDEYISLIKGMIKRNNNDKYIVCNVPTYDTATWAETDRRLGSEFGDHYLDVRAYISQYGLSDAGLTPTAADISAMQNGAIPPQLLNPDNIHMTGPGYEAMAKCIYDRGKVLGFWN